MLPFFLFFLLSLDSVSPSPPPLLSPAVFLASLSPSLQLDSCGTDWAGGSSPHQRRSVVECEQAMEAPISSWLMSLRSPAFLLPPLLLHSRPLASIQHRTYVTVFLHPSLIFSFLLFILLYFKTLISSSNFSSFWSLAPFITLCYHVSIFQNTVHSLFSISAPNQDWRLCFCLTPSSSS